MRTANFHRHGATRRRPAAAALGLGFLVYASAAVAQAPAPQNACWTAAALAARSGEERIQSGIPDAYRAPPVRTPVEYTPLRERGVIRRVELPPNKKLIALTFDLCEQPDEIAGYQGGIVDFLREHRIKATFFAGGKWMLSHQARAQQLMADRLFEVGNHTWEHRNLRLHAGSEMIEEIERAELAYEQVRERLENAKDQQCIAPGGGTLAERNAPRRLALFRFPFGACDAKSLEAVSELGLRAIQWDVSSGDPTSSQSAEQMARSVLAEVRPGSIVLFHANGRGWHTPAALPKIIAELRARGYQFVTVSELLAEGAPVMSRTCYDSQPGDTERYDTLARKLEARYQRFKERVAAQSAKPAETEGLAVRPPISTPAHNAAERQKTKESDVEATEGGSPGRRQGRPPQPISDHATPLPRPRPRTSQHD